MKIIKYLGMAIILGYFWFHAIENNDWNNTIMMGITALVIIADGIIEKRRLNALINVIKQ
jgi:hypothetical protein